MVRPLASVAFADDLSPADRRKADAEAGGFRGAAESAVDTIAAEFEGWGPKVHKQVRSGSPANEIIKVAKAVSAGLVVVAAGGRGLSDVVLVGSTAQRVQHYAPCPVLVVRPAPRRSKRPARPDQYAARHGDPAARPAASPPPRLRRAARRPAGPAARREQGRQRR